MTNYEYNQTGLDAYNTVMGMYTIQEKYQRIEPAGIWEYRSGRGRVNFCIACQDALICALSTGNWNNPQYRRVMRRSQGKPFIRGAFRVFYFRALREWAYQVLGDLDKAAYFGSFIGITRC